MKKTVFEQTIDWNESDLPVWAFALYLGRHWYGHAVHINPYRNVIHVYTPARGFDTPDAWEVLLEKSDNKITIKIVQRYEKCTGTSTIINEVKEVISWINGYTHNRYK